MYSSFQSLSDLIESLVLVDSILCGRKLANENDLTP
jgi:hypothetical protein